MARRLARRRSFLFGLAAAPAALLGIWVGQLLLAPPPQPVGDHPFVAGDGPLVIAHRGGRGQWPENTLYAFERSTQIGVDVLEMDVRGAADGTLVVFHDERVGRITDGEGRVADLSHAELAALDAAWSWSPDGGQTHPYRGRGLRIPTLAQVFRALPDMRMNLEIKDDSLPQPLCAAIRAHGMQQRVLVASFGYAAMREFRELCSEVATSTTAREVQRFWLATLLALPALYEPRAEAFQVPERLGRLAVVTPDFLRGARRLNVRVHVWTANRVEELERLLALGVDGIMTDYPERLLRLLGR